MALGALMYSLEAIDYYDCEHYIITCVTRVRALVHSMV